MKRILIIPALALMAAGLACSKHASQERPDIPVAKVHLAPDAGGAEPGWIAATVSATQRATLSTRLAASVRKVHVNEGQRVAAGALLVSLGDEDLKGGLKAAEAAVASASAQHRRMEALLGQKAATAAEMDMAKSQLAQAHALLAQAKGNIAFTQIRAPFAGVVQARRVNDGDFVGPGTPLLEMEGQGAMELVGSVSQSESTSLKLGQNVSFEADGRTGSAVITGLSTGGDPLSHRGTLRARVLSGIETLRSGAFARIKLPGAASPSPSMVSQRQVPATALVARGELNGVFVVKDGKAELRWLSLGEAQGGFVPVRAGLAKGERVIDQPGQLKDGQSIEVIP